MRQMLRPLSLLFEGVTSFRNWLFEKGALPIYQSALPVISIGNISVGGTGKTPLVEQTAHLLREIGGSPVILSRGYGGSLKGPCHVLPHHNAQEVGDEPLMLAQKLGMPVVIAKDRAAGARYIEEKKLGSVIVLDDGFQHRFLARALDIVTIDLSSQESTANFLRGALLPEGILRENRARAMRRVNAVVLSMRGADPDPELISGIAREVPEGIPLFESKITLHAVEALGTGAPLPTNEIFAFSGIANPQGFRRLLAKAGLTIVGDKFFGDHHSFTEDDLALLEREARGAPLVCTEKDAVKLGGMATRQIFVTKISCQISPEENFRSLLSSALRSHAS